MMAEKEQRSPYPIANGYARSSDTEGAAAAHDARELRKKKRNKCLLYIVLFVIFQSGIIALFALTVMKVRTPKFRIREAEVTNLSNANTSLTATLKVEFSVKNTNFGRYKYRNTNVTFFYRDTPVGTANVGNSRAGWRSTKKFEAMVDLNLASLDRSDSSAGSVTITSQAKMRGRVELMFVMKKNRATDMECTMQIRTAQTQQDIGNISCK